MALAAKAARAINCCNTPECGVDGFHQLLPLSFEPLRQLPPVDVLIGPVLLDPAFSLRKGTALLNLLLQLCLQQTSLCSAWIAGLPAFTLTLNVTSAPTRMNTNDGGGGGKLQHTSTR